MKKIKFKIIGVIIGIVCLSGIAFAINTISTGYKTTSNYQVIKNKQVKHTGSNSYFVPTKTDNEWNNFVSHKPSDVSIIDNYVTVCNKENLGKKNKEGKVCSEGKKVVNEKHCIEAKGDASRTYRNSKGERVDAWCDAGKENRGRDYAWNYTQQDYEYNREVGWYQFYEFK